MSETKFQNKLTGQWVSNMRDISILTKDNAIYNIIVAFVLRDGGVDEERSTGHNWIMVKLNEYLEDYNDDMRHKMRPNHRLIGITVIREE